MITHSFKIAVIFFACELGSAEGAAIYVPAMYPTIQTGIDAAMDGDTVLAAAGTYSGAGNVNLNFTGKAIVVKSAEGADYTIIDGQNRSRGVMFVSGEGNNSVFEGFQVINGYGGSDSYGGGILCWESSPVIRENRFVQCQAYYGGGIGIIEGNPTVEGNIFQDNTAERGGGMIIAGGSASVNGNSFIDNYSSGG